MQVTKGREIYTTFFFPDGHEKVLKKVHEKFESNVAPEHDEVAAAVHFSRRKQGADEKFDNFVADLKILVKDCGYEDEDRMVRDAIVLRSYHAAMQEKCLDEKKKLTLESAITIGQNHETAQEGLKLIGIEKDAKVHTVRQKRTHRWHVPSRDGKPKGEKFKGDKKMSQVSRKMWQM